MKETRLTFPELALIAGTRVAAGAGVGLLLSNRLSESERRAVGWTLLLAGALSTVPLALEIFSNRRAAPSEKEERTDSAPLAEAESQDVRSSTLART